MPMRKNEKPVLGPWKAEVWSHVGPYRWAWRNYNRPRFHIHSGVKYEFSYLAKNLKDAQQNSAGVRLTWVRDGEDGKFLPAPFVLRMRNIETGDIIPAIIL
jgi:hypothetical protein